MKDKINCLIQRLDFVAPREDWYSRLMAGESIKVGKYHIAADELGVLMQPRVTDYHDRIVKAGLIRMFHIAFFKLLYPNLETLGDSIVVYRYDTLCHVGIARANSLLARIPNAYTVPCGDTHDMILAHMTCASFVIEALK